MADVTERASELVEAILEIAKAKKQSFSVEQLPKKFLNCLHRAL